MTVIAAYTDGRRCWMAADSLTTDNGGQRLHRRTKIARLSVGRHDEALIATAGAGSLHHLVRHDLGLPASPDPRDEADCDAWAYRVARAFAELAADLRPAAVDKDGDIDGAALLAFGGRVWLLGQNDPVPAVDGILALGCGELVALGYLTALADRGELGVDPAAELTAACEAACRWQARCGGPIVVEAIGA